MITTKAQIDRDIDEARALVKISEAIRDADLTPIQAIDVLARALAERAKRMVAHEERDLRLTADSRGTEKP